MARKHNPREEGGIRFDTRTRTVMTESRQENLREKIKAVREVVPGKNRDELVMVLQYFEYNVEKTIQAYLEDGAKKVLQEWSHTQPNKKGKRKDRPEYIPKSKQEAALKAAAMNGTTETPGTNHINEESTADKGNTNLPNGHVPEDHSDSPEHTDNETPSQPPPSTTATTTTTKMNDPQPPPPQQQRHQLQQRGDRSKGKGPRESHSVHHNSVKLHHQRERTMSERSNASSFHGDSHHSLDKSFKDLQRQTTSLERLKHLLDSEIDRSSKSVKKVFEEIRKGLDERESKVLSELEVVKTEANEMLESRNSKAKDLKRMVERAERMNESEIAGVRSQIKHFVTDRRHDEELGRTTRFMYDSDHMLNAVQTFGEVIHIPKVLVRRPSTPSTSADSHNNVSGDHSHHNGVADIEARLKHDLHIQDSSVQSHQRAAPSNGPRNKGSADKQPRGAKSPQSRKSTTPTSQPPPPSSSSSSLATATPQPQAQPSSSSSPQSPKGQRPQQQRQRRSNRGGSGGAAGGGAGGNTSNNNNNASSTTNPDGNSNNSNNNNNRSSTNRGGGSAGANSNRGQGRGRGSGRGRGGRGGGSGSGDGGYRGNQQQSSPSPTSNNTSQPAVPV